MERIIAAVAEFVRMLANSEFVRLLAAYLMGKKDNATEQRAKDAEEALHALIRAQHGVADVRLLSHDELVRLLGDAGLLLNAEDVPGSGDGRRTYH